MTDSKQIKAFIVDDKGQLTPVAASSLVLEFSPESSLEISWKGQHPDDPRPVHVQIWGGRCPREDWSEEDIRQRSSQVAILPAGGNLVLVHPYSLPDRT
ncbi:hypothetical protein [Herbaspirillum sp. RV1423]|uniref:hypothetical protein n=1 Tax=Herbaspirillum sp. RV1423 TaxID=1443993 RepID=UPI0004B3BA0E|nr:hypothetical protein [Herbaspirillum sp. RV1423]